MFRLYKNKITHTLSTLVLAIFSANVAAIEPAPISFSGITLTPTLSVSEEYDDNVRNSPATNNNASISSWVTRIAPNFVLKAEDRLNIYQLTYGLTRENVTSSHDDSHTDHHAEVITHLEFDVRNRLDLYANYSEAKARTDSTNNVNGETGNESTTYSAGARYSYGTDTSKGQLEFGTQYGRLEYDNNFDTGSVTRERERDVFDLDVTFLYRMTAKTQALAEVQYHDYDYQSSTSLLDGNSQIYRLGVKWEATAKTTGEFRIGMEEKEFDLSSRASVTNPSWYLAATWAPRTYSVFTLSSNSSIDEGSATENHIESTVTNLTWDHAWSEYVSSDINYSYSNKEYFGDSNNGREDDIDSINLGMSYKLKRWLDVGVYYKYTDTESNDAASVYDRNLVGMTVDLSL